MNPDWTHLELETVVNISYVKTWILTVGNFILPKLKMKSLKHVELETNLSMVTFSQASSSNLDSTVSSSLLHNISIQADARMQVCQQMLHVKRYVLEHMTAHEADFQMF